MKTRDRILTTSLLLFNTEGEQNVTTVDIANEMDISPGNLYYHFRGKESIITALYTEYESNLTGLLNQSLDIEWDLEQLWLFLYVIFEEIHRFRFFYLNSSELILRYSDIERRFRRLVKNKVLTIETLCKNFLDEDALADDFWDSKLLAENISLCLLYWFPYQYLLSPKSDSSTLIHRGVYNILSLLVPYTGNNQQDFLLNVQSMYKENI